MKLYYGLTNYHLLCSIVHKLIYNNNEKTIFVASQGILKSRIENLRNSNIFDEVYYIEDTNIRNSYFEKLKENSLPEEIEAVAKEFEDEYEKFLPFNINDFSDIYLAADHGVFGIYILIKNHNYIYLEDGRGIYSNWKVLDKLLKIKNPGIQIMSSYYRAYGRSNLIKRKFIAFESQILNCDFTNCVNFEVDRLLDALENKYLETIFNIFNVKKVKDSENIKKALILTQRFSTYNMINQEDCVLLYALLCDIFAKDRNVYLKPHPADKCIYDDVFNNAVILEKELPSELIKYVINEKFDIGICTYSSSIHSLKNCINNIYNIDESVVEFKNHIFKLYILFEIMKKIKGNIIVDDSALAGLFKKCYNFEKEYKYIFNFSNNFIENANIIKDKFFNEANFRIIIKKQIENKYISKDLLKEYEILYLKIIDKELSIKLENIKIDDILPISKVHIDVEVECI